MIYDTNIFFLFRYIVRSSKTNTQTTTWPANHTNNKTLLPTSKTTVLPATKFHVHTNMMLCDLRKLINEKFQFGLNVWKQKKTFRLKIIKLPKSQLENHQKNNHQTLGDLGCTDGLALYLHYFTMKQEQDTDTAAVAAAAAVAAPAVNFTFGAPSATMVAETGVAAAAASDSLFGLEAKNVVHPSLSQDEEAEEEEMVARTPGEYIANSMEYSSILFDIIEQSEEGNNDIAQRAWNLLMEIPSIEKKRLHILKGMSTDVEWEQVMRSGSHLHSVYIFQLIDTLLSPATMMKEDDDAGSASSPSSTIECKNFCGVSEFFLFLIFFLYIYIFLVFDTFFYFLVFLVFWFSYIYKYI